MANEDRVTSAVGIARLRVHEGAAMRYYNDIGNHCTFGIGALAHRGPCTAEELQRVVTPAQVDTALALRVRDAEAAVRRRVTRHDLTQAQFDALVSFTYNAGAGRAQAALRAADQGDFVAVASEMNAIVYVHPRDAHGRPRAPVRVEGLVRRRREESAPFAVQPRSGQ